MKIFKNKDFKERLKIASNSLKQGEVLICPTDTVYGLVADATNEKAVERVFKIKKREKTKSLPIFIKDLKMAKQLAKINEKQEEFLKRNWPGKVTAVLERKGKRKIYGVERKTIALRIPNYQFINKLLEKTKRPLTGTSANLSGKPSSLKIKEILKQFKNQKLQPDLVIDAGELPKNKPSTVIDLTVLPFKVLRK